MILLRPIAFPTENGAFGPYGVIKQIWPLATACRVLGFETVRSRESARTPTTLPPNSKAALIAC